MPNDKQAPRELKVTDKRIFTADGEIKDEFKNEIHAAVPQETAPPAAETPKPEAPQGEPAPSATADRAQSQSAGDERRKEAAERGERAGVPATPFTQFIEPLVVQAYMSLGLMNNPYQPQAKPDPRAARQLIDILALLKEKTAGNLTPDEDEFLDTHLGELKLAYVQRTKTI